MITEEEALAQGPFPGGYCEGFGEASASFVVLCIWPGKDNV